MKRNKKYIKAMLKAIDKARRSIWTNKLTTKTNGLRVIKRFERVNGCDFDPFNKSHVSLIKGHGENEDFFRAIRIKKIFDIEYSK